MVYFDYESYKMNATKIPYECLWHEKWVVGGYVGIELAQSSYDFELSYIIVHMLFCRMCICKIFLM